MDFIEEFLKSEHMEVIMEVVDWFIIYAHCMALSHPYTTPSVSQVFIDNVYKLHGLSILIISDRDLEFMSKL
jgi:hypothetical protein